ncbi:MAG: DUF424 domain-containing protein [Candidatus Norongarragalinales archaeon]
MRNALKSSITARVHLRSARGFETKILALCDTELLGKCFTQGEKTLDLKAYRSFYEGYTVTEIQAVELLRNAENVNIVGEKSVAAAQKALGFNKANVKKIKGIPHLQFYRI